MRSERRRNGFQQGKGKKQKHMLEAYTVVANRRAPK